MGKKMTLDMNLTRDLMADLSLLVRYCREDYFGQKLHDFLRKYFTETDITEVFYGNRNNEWATLIYTTDMQSNTSYIESYLEEFYQHDPMYMAHKNKKYGVFLPRDILGDDFTDTPYYQRYFLQLGWSDEMFVSIPVSSGETFAVSLSLRNRTFDDDEIATLKMLYPLLEELVLKFWRKNYIHFFPAGNTDKISEINVERALKDICTKRERELVSCYFAGMNSKDTAKKMNISLLTLKTHRRNIYKKLNIHTQMELTHYILHNSHVLS